MIEMRLRTKRSDAWADEAAGTFVTPAMLNVRLEGTEPIRVLKPDGKPLCVYLPRGALEVTEQTFDQFSTIRGMSTNRGYASGSERIVLEGAVRGRTAPIASSILGSFDPAGGQQYCRLTAFTAKQVDRWTALLPYFKVISDLLEQYVPTRYAAQLEQAAKTEDDWLIQGTPFTTITVNNTYPTAIHTDKGDLDAGFSTLGCMRKGRFEGGWLTFPQYGVFADMQHGDVLLMDAHDWHGNTPITCYWCGDRLKRYDHRCEEMPEDEDSPERVSIVSYYRTAMVKCASLEEENAKRLAVREKWTSKAIGLFEGDDDDPAYD